MGFHLWERNLIHRKGTLPSSAIMLGIRVYRQASLKWRSFIPDGRDSRVLGNEERKFVGEITISRGKERGAIFSLERERKRLRDKLFLSLVRRKANRREIVRHFYAHAQSTFSQILVSCNEFWELLRTFKSSSGGLPYFFY